jgi:hypothetical protein
VQETFAAGARPAAPVPSLFAWQKEQKKSSQPRLHGKEWTHDVGATGRYCVGRARKVSDWYRAVFREK